MDNLSYARAQMGLSLAFHIVFAALGVALPLLMVAADVLWLRTRDADYLEFSKRMAKGTSILFAVGAVSGTVLSFELGLLWPGFMKAFGEVFGLSFALEGFAFFTEAIFLGIYLYGRDKLPPKLHLLAGIAVAVSGALSAAFVVQVNAGMNLPAGFQWVAGKAVDVDPLRVLFCPAWPHEVVHVLLSCYEATAFALAGVHAAVLLRRPDSALFQKAFRVTAAVACVSALLQPLSGDRSAKDLARAQPAKLAAAEALFQTTRRAPMHLGGLPDEATQTVPYSIEVPGALSFLAFADRDAMVTGLDATPRSEWPPVASVHFSFDVMVAAGSALAALAVVTLFLAWRRRSSPWPRWLCWTWVLASPLGIVAMESGWLVTELGRQPWVVRGMMRTAEAVTPVGYQQAPFWVFTAVYVFLGITVAYLLWNQLKRAAVQEGGGHAA